MWKIQSWTDVKPGLSSPALCGLRLRVCAVGVTVAPASQGCADGQGRTCICSPGPCGHSAARSAQRPGLPRLQQEPPAPSPSGEGVRSYWRGLEQGNEGVSSSQATGAGPCPICVCRSKPEPGESRPCLRRGDAPGDSGHKLRGSQPEFVSRGSGS